MQHAADFFLSFYFSNLWNIMLHDEMWERFCKLNKDAAPSSTLTWIMKSQHLYIDNHIYNFQWGTLYLFQEFHVFFFSPFPAVSCKRAAARWWSDTSRSNHPTASQATAHGGPAAPCARRWRSQVSALVAIQARKCAVMLWSKHLRCRLQMLMLVMLIEWLPITSKNLIYIYIYNMIYIYIYSKHITFASPHGPAPRLAPWWMPPPHWWPGSHDAYWAIGRFLQVFHGRIHQNPWENIDGKHPIETIDSIQ